MKPGSFDPRAWNILAGLCLTSGCSGRTIGADDGGPDASGTETTTVGTLETGGPECQTDDDCTPGYYCLEGVCYYQPVPDGHWEYNCYSDGDCRGFELCNYGY